MKFSIRSQDAQLITAKELREARRVHPPKKVNVVNLRLNGASDLRHNGATKSGQIR